MIYGIYFIVGILYTLVNVLIRKMDVDDPLLVLVWIGLWPIAWVVLVIHFLEKKYANRKL